jgi:hypothetical protein
MRRKRASQDASSAYSHVGEEGCIDFLNRESQVRFLPGALRSVVFRLSWTFRRHLRFDGVAGHL